MIRDARHAAAQLTNVAAQLARLDFPDADKLTEEQQQWLLVTSGRIKHAVDAIRDDMPIGWV